MRRTTRLLSIALALTAHGALAADVSFNRDIRPILAESCFKCHGPDPNTREAELRLDTRAGATADRDGSVAVVPGDAAASQLIARISSDDPDMRMPPAATGNQLSPAQITLLGDWVAQGAVYQRHWALEPVRRPGLPNVHSDWPRNAIDHFVLEKLQQQKLSPSPQADRHTLIRRVYLDLLGLLPTVEEADAFVSDDRPDAYQRMVDRVLGSPHFGQRWGRHWLDQARYADSHGYTNDNERVMWPYRDWVIDAFNRDLPFDQFTVEQLAGDLLPQPTLQQTIATGFHRNTLINTEGGTKADQFRDEQVKDRVDTTGSVWLGLTVGCAKCHTHKYDPISQAEYYGLYAFFNSTADSNSIPPVVKAPSVQQQARLDALAARQTQLEQQIADDTQRAARQQAWEAALVKSQSDDEATQKTKWTVLKLDGKSQDGATLTALEDNSLLVSGENTIADEYQLTAAAPLTKIRSVRLEVLTHGDLPKRGPGRADNGNFVLAEMWFRTGDGRELRFSRAQADHSQVKFDAAGIIDGNAETGWAVNGSPEGGPNHNRTAWFVLPELLEVEQDHALTFVLQHHKGTRPYNIGRLRLAVSSEEWIDRPSADELAKLAAVPADKRSGALRQRLDEAFLRSDARLGPIHAELQSIAKERDGLNSRIASTMVMRELPKPRPAHVQIRGDFLRRDEIVAPGVPAVLPPLSAETPNRLALAQWLVRDDNPLTPRVRVNRLWMRLFGRGLVETENDFGTQGTLPSHGELLDWLASETVRQAWSTKAMLRLIVTSATYQQASHARADADKLDPMNQWLWRQNRVRVESEIVRDLALSASGLLSNKIGGPSVYPPQPEGVYAFTQRKKTWKTSQGEDRYRRGMYTFFYRSAPYPMLTTFDAPKFNQTCTRRDRSNTPLQSLTVANDEALFELTQALANRLLAEGNSGESTVKRIERLFRLCLVRPPAVDEAKFLEQFFNQQQKHFAAHPKAAQQVAPRDVPTGMQVAEAAAWVATARVLLNLDEFITRE